jgi:glycosyltransferase involved in cell wall biosynthesis
VTTAPVGPEDGLRASVGAVRRTVRALDPAVVHSHLSWADVVAALATTGHRSALVTTEHGIAADDLVYHRSTRQARLMAAVHRGRFRRVDAVVAVSEATATAMRAKWGVAGPIRVVRNGVDPPREHPRRQAGLRVLSLARLAPEKRLDHLLDAFALVVRDHPEASLTVAGVGPLEADLRERTRALGLTDSVDFPGYLDAEKALADADVVAMLSVWENCSYTLLDATAAGLGVVASPVGGNPEMLPTRCLADPSRPEDVAAVLVRQGLSPEEHPVLGDWPDVPAMCADLAEVYAGGGA